MKNYKQLEATERFLKDAIKGSGFTFESCIAEFIDNSIDANAKNITLEFKSQLEKNFYSLTITDDGNAIPLNKLFDVVSKIGYGSENDYKSNSISNFGLGLKFAIINLCEYGESIIYSTHNKQEGTIFFNVDNIPSVSEVKIISSNSKNGIEIFIPNIKTSSNAITNLIKFIGCTYFPHIDNGNKLNIYVINDGKKTKIEYSDPFYRNIKDGTTYFNNYECDIEGYKIFIKGMYTDHSFNSDNLISWDNKQGKAGFANQRSGVYFRLGGRYITLGKGEFYAPESAKSDQSIRNRLRIEVEIDRALISKLGITFNKSRIVTNFEDPDLIEFLTKMSEMVSWGSTNLWNLKPKKESNLSPEELEINDQLQKDINSRRRKFPIDIEDLNIENRLENRDLENSETDGTKNRPKEIGPYNKELINFKYIEAGKDTPCFDYWREGKKLIIQFNTDHNFYSYYRKLSLEGKRISNLIILSFIDSISFAKFESEDNFWEKDLLRNLSSRLEKYCKL